MENATFSPDSTEAGEGQRQEWIPVQDSKEFREWRNAIEMRVHDAEVAVSTLHDTSAAHRKLCENHSKILNRIVGVGTAIVSVLVILDIIVRLLK